ncbi:MAG: ABC transporter substrate-binding protein, partial [Candidatus Eisenbacteria bacterium]
SCRDVPAGSGGWGGGGATHSVFAPELVFERSVNEDARAYTWFHEGMTRGFGQGDLVRWMRVRSPGAETARDPRLLGQLQRTDPAGLYVGDPAGRIGAIALALSGSAQVPFLALGAPTEESVSPNPARPPGVRLIRLSPGPQMRARLLAGAARAQGVHRVALATPGEGGDMRLARALLEVASEFDLEVLPLEYTSGRRERRDDVARLRASGADAVALLGPGEESADWLIALKAGGKPLLVLGTEELDPAGFHEQARRAAEGAIFVRGSYTPVGAGSGVGSDEGPLPASAAECYVAGWLIADAIAHGADTPWTLEQALEKRIVEGDALDAWPAIPPTVARVEMSRIRNGQAEPLP